MQFKFNIFKKANRTILLLTSLMFVTIISMNYYNYKKNINEAKIKNLINNLYFKKTLFNIFNQLEPKHQKIDHIITKGETLTNIFEKY